MAFTIRSRDGRLSICTYGAVAAADHLDRLRGLGLKVRVFDFNGRVYRAGDLRRRAAEPVLD